jgi:hypothetical protein
MFEAPLAEISPLGHDGWELRVTLWRFFVKRVLAAMTIALTLAPLSAMAADSTINGYISDAMCGAKHAGTGAACAKKCLAGGEAPVFVDEAKKEVWTIDNPDAVKSFYGDHVTVTATADASKKSVHINTIAEAK